MICCACFQAAAGSRYDDHQEHGQCQQHYGKTAILSARHGLLLRLSCQNDNFGALREHGHDLLCEVDIDCRPARGNERRTISVTTLNRLPRGHQVIKEKLVGLQFPFPLGQGNICAVPESIIISAPGPGTARRGAGLTRVGHKGAWWGAWHRRELQDLVVGQRTRASGGGLGVTRLDCNIIVSIAPCGTPTSIHHRPGRDAAVDPLPPTRLFAPAHSLQTTGRPCLETGWASVRQAHSPLPSYCI